MSHSTTSTATYLLQKYSRSYENNAEWQHFTNPVIKLILDVRKSSAKAELESVLLRIVWSMDGSNPMTFENLDLLSFSSLPSRNKQQAGLSLKAVYRDSVVGIRYLHASTFRRFQITFLSANDASNLIDAISSVCPCKLNPAATGAQTQIAPIMATPSIAPSMTRHPKMNPSVLSRPQQLAPNAFPTAATPSLHQTQHRSTSHVLASGLPMSSSPVNMDHAMLPPPASSPQFDASQPHSQSSSWTTPTPSHAMLPPPASSSQFDASQPHSQNSSWTAPTPSQPERPYSQSSNPLGPSNPISSWTAPAPSQPERPYPHSNVPGPTNRHSMSRSPSRPSAENLEKTVQTSDSDQFIAALQSATSLYDLPHSTLEKLVGDVVREDGFIHLMEELSSMWKIKGYLG